MKNVEKIAKKIIGQQYDSQEQFEKAIEPYISNNYKNTKCFIMELMRHKNEKIKERVYNSKLVEDFLHNNNPILLTDINGEDYAVEEIFKTKDEVFLLDLYPWKNGVSGPVRNNLQKLYKEYKNVKIIIYDVDHKWKLLVGNITKKIDKQHEDFRKEILKDKMLKKEFFKHDRDYTKRKYIEENTLKLKEYSGPVPENFQQVLICQELSNVRL